MSKLSDIFASKNDEFKSWTPVDIGEIIMGMVSQLGISAQFETPFIVLNVKGELITVYCKTGIAPTLQREELLAGDNTWSVKAKNSFVNKYVAFQYLGMDKNPKSNRSYQKYKVLFHHELEKAGVLTELLLNNSDISNTVTTTNSDISNTVVTTTGMNEKKITPISTKKVKKIQFATDQEIAEVVKACFDNDDSKGNGIDSSQLYKSVNQALTLLNFSIIDTNKFVSIMKALSDSGSVYQPKPDVYNILE